MDVENEIRDLALGMRGHRDAAHIAFLFLVVDLHRRGSVDLPWLIQTFREVAETMDNPYERDWLRVLVGELRRIQALPGGMDFQTLLRSIQGQRSGNPPESDPPGL